MIFSNFRLSFQLCLEFHKDDGELDELAYRQQKLAHASKVNHALPTDYVESLNKEFRKYHYMKAAITGKVYYFNIVYITDQFWVILVLSPPGYRG